VKSQRNFSNIFYEEKRKKLLTFAAKSGILCHMKKTLKVRRSWGDLNPATRRVESKKLYSRKVKSKKSGGAWSNFKRYGVQGEPETGFSFCL